MRLNEYFTYKTVFIYSKNDINFLPFFKDVTSEEELFTKENNYTNDNFDTLLYKKPRVLPVLKTKYGYFLKCDELDLEMIKTIIKENSKPECFAFGSHRVSDYYMFAYAKNSKIERYFSTDDSGVICEGTETIYEKNLDNKFVMPPDDDICRVDESDILTCINNCVGFDIESDNDIEIEDCKLYEWCGVEPNVDDDIITKITDNLTSQNIKNASVIFAKDKKNKSILAVSTVSCNNTENFLFSKICDSKFSYDNFLENYHSALYSLANFKFPDRFLSDDKNPNDKLFLGVKLYKTLNLKMDNVVTVYINTDDKNSVYLYLSKVRGKYVNEKLSMHNGDLIENYNLKDDKLVYTFVKDNIKRRTFRRFGMWNLKQ